MSDSFTVTLDTPHSMRWEDISDPIRKKLSDIDNVDEKVCHQMITYYAYLLRMRSWEKGIDWNPVINKVTISVPNSLINKDTETINGRRDGLATALGEIYQKTTIDYLREHFINV